MLAAVAGFGAVGLAHLVAQLTGPEALRVWTQVAVMPLLAAVVLTATKPPRSHLQRWLLLGLGMSWLGDSVPRFVTEHSFLLMVTFFLLAQVAYVVAFWPARRESVAAPSSRGWPWPLLGYVLALALLLVWCVPGAGPLLVPAVVYGVVLVAMAVLATGVHRLVAVGGILFVVSDGLIALDAFSAWYELAGHGFLVMVTYLAAQAFLVAGTLARKGFAPSD